MQEQIERRKQTSNLPEANMPDGYYLKTPLRDLIPQPLKDWEMTQFSEDFLKNDLYQEVIGNKKGDLSEILERVGSDFVNYYLKLVVLNSLIRQRKPYPDNETLIKTERIKFALSLEMENTGKIGDHDNVDFFDIPWMAMSKSSYILDAFESSTVHE